MLGLTSSIIKPTSLAKQRSVVCDGVVSSALEVSVVDNGLKPPQTAAGTDRGHTYAFWLKFINTDVDQGVFMTQANNQFGLNILLRSNKISVQEWHSGIEILDHEGDTVLTDAIKQDWMLWVITHERPADNSTGTHKIYLNGSTSTYGSETPSYSGSFVMQGGTGSSGMSFMGYVLYNAFASWTAYYLDGKVAQFGFWHRALSDAEILAMYNDPKMDWRYNSGNYTSTGIQRYYKPFSNQLDDAINFKFRDLVQWDPPTYPVCDDESFSSWGSLSSNTKTDLGGGETRFTIANSQIASFVILSGASVLNADVPTGTELTFTFKAKIVTTSTTTADFRLITGSPTSNVIPANQDYVDVTLVHTTNTANSDYMIFLMSGINAGDQLFIKDFVIRKTVNNPGEFLLLQTDQISDDAPGNNNA